MRSINSDQLLYCKKMSTISFLHGLLKTESIFRRMLLMLTEHCIQDGIYQKFHGIYKVKFPPKQNPYCVRWCLHVVAITVAMGFPLKVWWPLKTSALFQELVKLLLCDHICYKIQSHCCIQSAVPLKFFWRQDISYALCRQYWDQNVWQFGFYTRKGCYNYAVRVSIYLMSFIHTV